MPAKIAINDYTVKKDWDTDPVRALEKIKEIGYDGIEFSIDIDEPVFQEIAAKLIKLDLQAISTHVGFDDMQINGDLYFCRMHQLGIQYIGIPWLAENQIPGGERYNKTKESIEVFAKRCKAAGVSLFYHNHDFEFNKINGVCKQDILLNDIPSLLVQLDVCWCKVGGENPAEYIRRYARRTPMIHLKDYTLKSDAPAERLYDLHEIDGADAAAAFREANGFSFQPVGMGCVDFESVFRAADAIGIKWMVVEQDASTDRPPMEAAMLSLEYIRKNYCAN